MQQYRSRQSSFCPPRFTPGSHQSKERIESLQNYIYNKLTQQYRGHNTQHERKCASLALPRRFQDDYSANPGLGPSLSDTDVSDSPLILHMILTHTARTVPIIGVKPLNTTVICHVYNSMHSAVQSAPCHLSQLAFEPPRRRGPAFRDIRQSPTSQRHRTRHGIPTNPFTQLKKRAPSRPAQRRARHPTSSTLDQRRHSVCTSAACSDITIVRILFVMNVRISKIIRIFFHEYQNCSNRHSF